MFTEKKFNTSELYAYYSFEIDRADEFKAKKKSKKRKKSSVFKVTIGSLSSFNYNAISLMVQFLTAITDNTRLLSIYGSMKFFNNFVCNAITRSVIETQGILGSQAHGKKHYERLGVIFFQSLALNYALFCTLSLYVSQNFSSMCNLLGLHLGKEIIEEAEHGFRWLIPGFFLKILNENIKVFIQNEGKEASLDLGYWNIGLLVTLIPISAIIILILKIEVEAFGLIILIYELVRIYIFVTVSLQKIDTKISLKSSKKISSNFNFFLLSWIKTFISIAPVYFLEDISFVYLGVMDLEVDLAVHSVLSSISRAIRAFSAGYIAVSRTIINKKIGKNRIREAKKDFKKYERIGFYTGFLIFVFQAIFHFALIKTHAYGGEEFRQKISQSCVPYCFYWALSFNIHFYDCVLRSLDQKHVFHLTNFLYFSEIMIAYFFSFYLRMGVTGIGLCLCWTAFVKSWVVRSVIKHVEWDAVERWKRLVEREWGDGKGRLR